MQPIKLKNLKIENSLHNHGGVGLDFWKVENGCDTLVFSLDNDDVVKLAGWLVTYIEDQKK